MVCLFVGFPVCIYYRTHLAIKSFNKRCTQAVNVLKQEVKTTNSCIADLPTTSATDMKLLVGLVTIIAGLVTARRYS